MNSAIKISPELRDALQSYQDWVNAGAHQGQPFDRGTGLCSNLGHNANPWVDFDRYLVEELGDLFSSMCLCLDYPFGEEDYYEDCRGKTHHLHAPRNEWVKTVLGAANV